MLFSLYFTLKNDDVPKKGGHAERREKAALLCWHWPSERGLTEGREVGGRWVPVPLCPSPPRGGWVEGAGTPVQNMYGKSSFH